MWHLLAKFGSDPPRSSSSRTMFERPSRDAYINDVWPHLSRTLVSACSAMKRVINRVSSEFSSVLKDSLTISCPSSSFSALVLVIPKFHYLLTMSDTLFRGTFCGFAHALHMHASSCVEWPFQLAARATASDQRKCECNSSTAFGSQFSLRPEFGSFQPFLPPNCTTLRLLLLLPQKNQATLNP
jgi:hypothetical protein